MYKHTLRPFSPDVKFAKGGRWNALSRKQKVEIVVNLGHSLHMLHEYFNKSPLVCQNDHVQNTGS